jgi:hypothetical protein
LVYHPDVLTTLVQANLEDFLNVVDCVDVLHPLIIGIESHVHMLFVGPTHLSMKWSIENYRYVMNVGMSAVSSHDQVSGTGRHLVCAKVLCVLNMACLRQLIIDIAALNVAADYLFAHTELLELLSTVIGELEGHTACIQARYSEHVKRVTEQGDELVAQDEADKATREGNDLKKAAKRKEAKLRAKQKKEAGRHPSRAQALLLRPATPVYEPPECKCAASNSPRGAADLAAVVFGPLTVEEMCRELRREMLRERMNYNMAFLDKRFENDRERERKTSQSDATECCVCMTLVKTSAFVPCGHLCVCDDCAGKLLCCELHTHTHTHTLTHTQIL